MPISWFTPGRNCGVVGHLQRVCDQRPHAQSATKSKVAKRVKTVTVETDEEVDGEIDTIFLVGGPRSKPVELDVLVDNQPLSMELDTGASDVSCYFQTLVWRSTT